MKRFRILLPLFIGVVAYGLLGICFGPRGLRAMARLEEEKARLSANIDVLCAVNSDLQARLDNLSADPDTISVYAHELGYISEGEHLIKLAGFSGGIDRKMSTGTALVVQKPLYIPEWICKLIGILIGAIVYFLLSYYFPEKKHGSFKEFARFGR